MKEKSEDILKINELVENGVYMTKTKDLIQIRTIDKSKNRLFVYNITESCHMYFMDLEKHSIIKRIR